MKLVFFTLCLFVLTTGLQAQENFPKIKLEKELIDYGTIEVGSNGISDIKITNVGNQPLIIDNIISSCVCLTVSWVKEPVKPGATTVITLKYDTKRAGRFEKTVTIISNADTPSKVIKIKGVVSSKSPATGD